MSARKSMLCPQLARNSDYSYKDDDDDDVVQTPMVQTAQERSMHPPNALNRRIDDNRLLVMQTPETKGRHRKRLQYVVAQCAAQLLLITTINAHLES